MAITPHAAQRMEI
jgi:hypothetical protein